MLLTLPVVILLLAAGTHAKEELFRRRDLFSNDETSSDGVDEGETGGGFLRVGEWGASREGYYGMKGPKAAPKGMKTGGKTPKAYKKGPKKASKAPKATKGPKSNAKRYNPYDPSPSECPKIEDDCKIGGSDECSLHSTCGSACLPRFCKLPLDPHKIHHYGPPDEDKFVKLGSLCGYMKYNQGYYRHDFEVCCEVEEILNPPWMLPEYAECAECKDCIFPQKVADPCCKVAFDIFDDFGRDGTYHPACPEGEVCCKCGPSAVSYKCVPEHEHCDTIDCPDFPSAAPSEPPSPEPSDEPSPEPSKPPTGGSLVYGLQPDCNENDESRYNICLDLVSLSGNIEGWMNDVIAAAREMEKVVVDDIFLIFQGIPDGAPEITIPGFRDCSDYPTAIDDIYICAQDRVFPAGSRTIADAGPYVFRNPERTPPGLPIAAAIRVNVDFANDALLQRSIFHEIWHCLGFPVLSRVYGLFDFATPGSETYKRPSKADDEWQAIGCSGLIPLEDCSIPNNCGQFGPGHWNEACLDEELMTPIAGQSQPASRISIAALEDLGYGVDYSVAEPFTMADLGICGASCPAMMRASLNNTEIPKIGYAPSSEEKVSMMNEVKDQLMYFHNQLGDDCEYTSDRVLKCNGYYAYEAVTIRYMGTDEKMHSMEVSYNDVMSMDKEGPQ